MPEGHSIKILANRWEPLKSVPLTLTSPQGRFIPEAAALNGSMLVATHTHGKHLFLEFEHGNFVHIHLGLYGRCRFLPTAPEKLESVRLLVQHPGGFVALSGPTKCELIGQARKDEILAKLGPDFLDPNATLEPVMEWLKKSRWPVGKTLMEQGKMAGVGNVYRAELLFMLALNPWRLTKDVSAGEWGEIWKLGQRLLEAGVHDRHIATTGPSLPDPVTLPAGSAVEARTYVYMRTGLPCFSCETPIESAPFAGRTLYFCPTCQGGAPVAANATQE